MNYRHRFHAGNAADVFKHAVLVDVIDLLQQKDTPLLFIDTHAGAGIYALAAGGEHLEGVSRLWADRREWPELDHYLSILRRFNPGRLRTYPGSPCFLMECLRDNDRALLVEAHPDDAESLKVLCATLPRVAVHEGNGWDLVQAATPPREPRGLVLVDPPFEKTDDVARASALLQRQHHAWRHGVHLFWYPVKSTTRIEPLLKVLRGLWPEALSVECLVRPRDVAGRLNGSGLVIVNPPWRLRERLAAYLPRLAATLAGPEGRPAVSLRALHEITATGNKSRGRPRRMR